MLPGFESSRRGWFVTGMDFLMGSEIWKPGNLNQDKWPPFQKLIEI